MLKSAIIVLLINYGAFLFAQDIHYSRNFEARKKNIPLEIINNHNSYFHVLRLNNAVHDLTIERRAKPSAEIIAFTPLKLDSVNASWFNYEDLDYLFFEHDYKTYFLFERALNSKKTIYLKIIDTSGRSSGFIELASLERDKGALDIEFSYKRSGKNSILIVASNYGLNGITRKVAFLFDLTLRRVLWTKKLPLEVSSTDFTSSFECNAQHDLFYLQTKSTIVEYQSIYDGNFRYTIPVVKLDSLFIIKWERSSDFPIKKQIDLLGISYLQSSFVLPNDTSVFVSLQGQINYKDSVEARIHTLSLNHKDLSMNYYKTNSYTQEIKDQLTFYDGPQKEFYTKEHVLNKNFAEKNLLYTLSARKEGYYYKELLLWKTDLLTGEVLAQKIIPRKVFFFKNRTRFKNIAEVMMTAYQGNLKFVLLENPSNFKKDANVYNYGKFKKETHIWRSNIVSYAIGKDGQLEKKLELKSSDFDAIPLRYQSSSQKDVVFYLNNNKYEKFAISQLYP
jgi:hypothetical protein